MAEKRAAVNINEATHITLKVLALLTGEKITDLTERFLRSGLEKELKKLYKVDPSNKILVDALIKKMQNKSNKELNVEVKLNDEEEVLQKDNNEIAVTKSEDIVSEVSEPKQESSNNETILNNEVEVVKEKIKPIVEVQEEDKHIVQESKQENQQKEEKEDDNSQLAYDPNNPFG
ncbi:hypothetical protein [Clostridium thermobutyricum]|uniref:hypothetical protein n=1 Tax=Clostridium thermobutyricum TaxID=29372 RepID=UPI0018A9D33F|nr:hypothetical protein [Clostridium thermobutyricum]